MNRGEDGAEKPRTAGVDEEREDWKEGVWENQFYRSWGQMTPKPGTRDVFVWNQQRWSPDCWPMSVRRRGGSCETLLAGQVALEGHNPEEESQMAEEQRGKREQRNSTISGWKENRSRWKRVERQPRLQSLRWANIPSTVDSLLGIKTVCLPFWSQTIRTSRTEMWGYKRLLLDGGTRL